VSTLRQAPSSASPSTPLSTGQPARTG